MTAAPLTLTIEHLENTSQIFPFSWETKRSPPWSPKAYSYDLQSCLNQFQIQHLTADHIPHPCSSNEIAPQHFFCHLLQIMSYIFVQLCHQHSPLLVNYIPSISLANNIKLLTNVYQSFGSTSQASSLGNCH